MVLARPPLSCRPPFWAKGAHLQTLIANYLPEPHLSESWQPLDIPLQDGDRLAGREFPAGKDAVLCVFHGLGGDDDRPYVRRAVRLGLSRGLTVWTMNHRGCGRGRGMARGTYHSGSAGDLGAVFAAAREKHPGAKILGLGFSLSGNALLLNLGGGFDGPHPRPDAAIAVNPPVNLARCSKLLSKGLNKGYDRYFVKKVVRSVREREIAGLIPTHRYLVHDRMSLADFDDQYTAPAGGFADRHDYYARCSAAPHLPSIKAPTVILHAEDDPFVAAQDLRDAQLPPHVHLHMEATGGHMGYLSRDLPDRRWLAYALGHYLDQLLAI
jgi:predicted alpha/beta-fold hydrolase